MSKYSTTSLGRCLRLVNSCNQTHVPSMRPNLSCIALCRRPRHGRRSLYTHTDRTTGFSPSYHRPVISQNIPTVMSNENYLAMTEGVKTFLENLGLLQYYDIFLAKGFDAESDIFYLRHSDLDSMYISDPDHRRIITNAASRHRPSSEFQLYEWLRVNGLDHYFINFVQSELIEFDEIARVNLPDEKLYDELEITLPGHKRRLERAVQQLRKKKKISRVDSEVPVAHGRWGKPQCLTEAKYDFLVIDATVASTKDGSKNETLEFMVDSGSDVTTIREEVLERLDLELLGTIQSRGVHASRSKKLYKAKLQIGNQELEIEIMGETYDSLGSRVLRHFRHFINGTRHVWLKGDYADPDMSPRPESSRTPEIFLPFLDQSASPSSTTTDLPTSQSSSNTETSSIQSSQTSTGEQTPSQASAGEQTLLDNTPS
ncbi:hypothetical protein ScPMuIL_000999 [Solemya velum]